MANYSIEKSKEGILLVRTNVEHLKLRSIEGLCTADQKNPNSLRDIKTYQEQVLNPGISSGAINDGTSSPFDDRKMRYHSSSIYNETLEIAFGFSHYAEYKVPFTRNTAENEFLRNKGKREFNDQYAYFARAPGVAALVLSSEGHPILGERTVAMEEGQSDQYQGLLHAVGGHLDFRQDPRSVKIEEDVLRELGEFGISHKSVKSMIFVGLYANPKIFDSDLDFTYIVSTDLPSTYFTLGRWEENATKKKEKEHKNLVALQTFEAVENLLHGGKLPSNNKCWDIIFSTRAALCSLKIFI